MKSVDTYPVLLREERQSKVDAFAVMQMAGEQLFVIHETL